MSLIIHPVNIEFMTFINETTGQEIRIADDFMSYVYIDGKLVGPAVRVFPGARLDFYRGVLIDKDGIMHCSQGCNSHVAQYDGCHYLSCF